jgi:hypothetical protein
MKIIIAGTRTFDNKHLLSSQMDWILSQLDLQFCNIHVVSGTAEGADKLGEEWAEERKITVSRFPPDWNKHGKAAGPIRNSQMADVADMCVVFWDGKSKGTKNMIETALSKGLFVKVVKY